MQITLQQLLDLLITPTNPSESPIPKWAQDWVETQKPKQPPINQEVARDELKRKVREQKIMDHKYSNIIYKHNQKDVTCFVDIPGFDKSEIKVSTFEGVILVRASNSKRPPVDKEIPFATVGKCDFTKITCSLLNGVLSIIVPKIELAQATEVPIA